MSYKWYWMADNGWIAFDAKKSADLEKGFNNKAKSVTLDKERFVDLSLSWSEICKNFTNLTDKTMVGIQRRFDDHNKRRAVKREKDTSVSTNFFDGLEFAFLSQVQGNKMKVKENDFVSKVKMYGGKVVATLSKNVDYVVVTTPSLDDASVHTTQAETLKIPIVFSSFITKCILDSSLVDHKSFIAPVPKPKKVAESDDEEEVPKKKTTKKKDEEGEGEGEGEDEEAPKAKKGGKKKKKVESDDEEEDEKPKKKAVKDSKKRKADSDEEEDEEEPKVKKSKVDNDKKKDTSNSATTTTTTTTTTATPATSGSTEDGLKTLQPGTEWMGVYTDPSDTASGHFPFLLQVIKLENSTFEGFIFWKTMNDAQTKIRGKFAPNGNGGDLDIDFEEYEAVVGEDEVELPNSYSGVLSGKSISGRVGDKSSKATFKVDLIKPGVFKVRVPQTWDGSCKADTPFVLNIAVRDDDEVSGTVEWQTTPPTITKWRGKVNGLKLLVEEYEVVKGDDEFLLKTWHLAVTQEETLQATTTDKETMVLNIK